MSNGVNPGMISVSAVPQGSPATNSAGAPASGKGLPSAGGNAASAGPPSTSAAVPSASGQAAPRATTTQSIVDILNQHLNDSGRPAQYRVDPSSADKLIQEINPANGAVIGEFSLDEFPALARSVGIPGLIVDDVA
jgi:hypothetical protein